MNESRNAAVIRRWLDEVWKPGGEATVRELLAPGAVGHLQGLVTRGIDEFLAARAYLMGAFPDMRITVDALIAVDEHVSVRWSVTGTHLGALLDIPPSGKAVAFHGITWFDLADGRIVEGWDVWNQGRLFAELKGTA